MWILLIKTNFILPVGQPVALQGAATSGELLFQDAVLWRGACHPGGGERSCTSGWCCEGGGCCNDRCGMTRASPRVSQANVWAATIVSVSGYLNSVSYEVAPKCAWLRKQVSLQGGTSWEGWKRATIHTSAKTRGWKWIHPGCYGGCFLTLTYTLMVRLGQLPDQLMIRN